MIVDHTFLNARLTREIDPWHIRTKMIGDFEMRYIHHTVVIHRLLEVCGPLGFQIFYHNGPTGVRCEIAILHPTTDAEHPMWVSKVGRMALYEAADKRSDYVTENPDAEALKTAAYLWGIGLELYSNGTTRFRDADDIEARINAVAAEMSPRWNLPNNPFTGEKIQAYLTDRAPVTIGEADRRAGWFDAMIEEYKGEQRKVYADLLAAAAIADDQPSVDDTRAGEAESEVGDGTEDPVAVDAGPVQSAIKGRNKVKGQAT